MQFGKRTEADEFQGSSAFFVGGSRRASRPQLKAHCGGNTIKGSSCHATLATHEPAQNRRRHVGRPGDPVNRPCVESDGGTQGVRGCSPLHCETPTSERHPGKRCHLARWECNRSPNRREQPYQSPHSSATMRPKTAAILAAVSRRMSRCLGSSAGCMNRSIVHGATPAAFPKA